MNDGEQRNFGPLGKVLVIIPTYNEAENVVPIVQRVRAAVPEAEVLVADDNSPDGTGKLADELSASDPAVHVLHRKGKEGLGAAYLAGFRWGIDHDFDVLVEMDADGSHQPEELPRLLTALKGADLVLGSRWIPGGRVVNWPKSREFISRGGSTYSRLMLGVTIRDVTGGYRAFRKETLLGLGMDDVASAGYCFQVDLAWRAVKAGFHVVEVPITFVERERGDSKMSRNIVAEALLRVTAWGVTSRAERITGRKQSETAEADRPDRKPAESADTAVVAETDREPADTSDTALTAEADRADREPAGTEGADRGPAGTPEADGPS